MSNIKVTHPNGKEVKLNEWGVWTHYGPNLHENFLNKQLVLNGFTPDRDRRGAHVRIHNNSTRPQDCKEGDVPQSALDPRFYNTFKPLEIKYKRKYEKDLADL